MSATNPTSEGKSVTPPAADAVALFHGLLLVTCADGTVSAKRIAKLDAYCRTLADLGQENFDLLMRETRKATGGFASLPESVAALGKIANPATRTKLFVLAVDLALAAGEPEPSVDEMLAEMVEVLGVNEEAAAKIVAVLRLKHQA